jgi:FixJ family two-component response regulator
VIRETGALTTNRATANGLRSHTHLGNVSQPSVKPEIAGELSVSVNTVSTHLRRIYAKLGANDRSAAVRRARELRLLSVGRTR